MQSKPIQYLVSLLAQQLNFLYDDPHGVGSAAEVYQELLDQQAAAKMLGCEAEYADAMRETVKEYGLLDPQRFPDAAALETVILATPAAK